MSRYYDITVGGLNWTSHPGGPGGQRDPGALDVELDLPALTAADAPAGTGFCRVWGVGLAMISQARNFANQPIVIKGGMGAGLPLCEPGQSGIIANGIINKFFANWEGVNQSIDFSITAGGTGEKSPAAKGPNPYVPPVNGVLDWKKGQPLSGPLQQTLQQMFPRASIKMNIGSIVAPQDMQGYHGSVGQLATFVRRMSQQIVGNNTEGVSIVPFGDTVNVFDDTYQPQGGQIRYVDLIGQPTWIEFNTIQVKVVMRGDIHLGDTITMPEGSIALGQLTAGDQSNAISFQGSFKVSSIRHVGHFRQPDGGAWCSIIQAVSVSS